MCFTLFSLFFCFNLKKWHNQRFRPRSRFLPLLTMTYTFFFISHSSCVNIIWQIRVQTAQCLSISTLIVTIYPFKRSPSMLPHPLPITISHEKVIVIVHFIYLHVKTRFIRCIHRLVGCMLVRVYEYHEVVYIGAEVHPVVKQSRKPRLKGKSLPVFISLSVTWTQLFISLNGRPCFSYRYFWCF